MSTQTKRLRDQLDASVEALHPTPVAMRRVVDTALELARQQPLAKATDPDPGVFEVPTLTGSWVRATEGLPHPIRLAEQRSITFDPDVAKRRRARISSAVC